MPIAVNAAAGPAAEGWDDWDGWDGWDGCCAGVNITVSMSALLKDYLDAEVALSNAEFCAVA
jgi:hypothetical protein